MINYGDQTITTWEVNDDGVKVSVPITNRDHQIIGNKIVLDGYPDEGYRVFIDGMVEINIRDKITEHNQFKVDYRKNGVVYFHPSLDGQWITVSSYHSRGMVFWPASRIWTKIDDFGNVIETLDSVVSKIEVISGVITDLDNVLADAHATKTALQDNITEGNNIKSQLDLTINDGNSINDILSDPLTGILKKATDINSTLTNTTSLAESTSTALGETLAQANITKTNLDDSITTGNTVKANLDDDIIQGNQLKTDLPPLINNGNIAKNNLDNSINTANTTKAGLDNSINEGTILKGEINDIIAGTNFEQVITDVDNLKANKADKIYVDNELGEKINNTDKGVPNGIAELDSTGKVPSSQLPSYVDDVLEYPSKTNFPVTGETGKIYVATDTNLTYRWSGTAYVEISPSLALGETPSTAYPGNKGKIAYDHSQSQHARVDATKTEKSEANGYIIINGVEYPVYIHPSGTNPHGTTKSDVGLANVDNVKQMPLSGGTFTGQTKFANDTSYGVFKGRNIASGTADPSGGSHGDIYFKRKA